MGGVRRLARKKRRNPRVKVRMFLNHKITDNIINLLILWALFMEEIRVAADLPKAPSQSVRQCDSTPPAGPRLTGSRPLSQAADKPFVPVTQMQVRHCPPCSPPTHLPHHCTVC